MKILEIVVISSCLSALAHAQTPFSSSEALKQIYKNYDVSRQTATLTCTDDQKAKLVKSPGTWWPCEKDDADVSVEALLTSTVSTWGDEKTKIDETYLVTSAVPNHDPAGFECHSCAPAIGVALFLWRDQKWMLESTNATIGLYGEWGSPPDVELISIGPSKHGILLSMGFEGQGYYGSSKVLLAPINKTVREVLRVGDEQDDRGAYDPKGVDGPAVLYRSAAALRFDCIMDSDCSNGYSDIEVISRGTSAGHSGHGLIQQNWTDIYQFKDGKYQLVRHQVFHETKVATRPKK